MKKTQIITILIALGIVTAMTGITAAAPENLYVDPGPKTIPYSPNSVIYNVQVYDIEDLTATHQIKATTNGWGAGTSADLEYKFTNEAGGTSNWIASGTSWDWGLPSTGNDEWLTLEIRAKTSAPPNNDYSFEVYDDGGTLNSGGAETASGTTTGISIPEFATIAIPAVAILGLFLFFNQRKHKKE